MGRYAIQLAYNGSAYFGWQVQRKHPSIQSALNNALTVVLREEIQVVGCGRTDTGVHAAYYVAHFDAKSEFLPAELTKKLNGFLPVDIKIFAINSVSDIFNARYDAISRTYKYYISTEKFVFLNDYTSQVYFIPDFEAMNQAASLLVGAHDFTSFSKLHTDTKTNICHVTKAEWKACGDRFVFEVQANRFLRNMVRAMVGTLLDVGKKKILPQDVLLILESKNRCNAGQSVPAKGLFLCDVEYDDSLLFRSYGMAEGI